MNLPKVVFACVVDDCPWTLEQTQPDLRHIPTNTAGMSPHEALNAYLNASISDGLARANQDDEMAARAHLMLHDVFDFARTITRLQNDLHAAEKAVPPLPGRNPR